MLAIYLAVLLVFLVVAGLVLLRQSQTGRRAAGLPYGKVIYVDTGALERCEKPLFSVTHRLAGRPDYLVRSAGSVIPVEVKPNRQSMSPRMSDVLQLAAYCLLVEEAHGRPSHGILKYRGAAFEIAYTPDLQHQLLDALQAMRRDRATGNVTRSHDDPARCAGCGVRNACDERLA